MDETVFKRAEAHLNVGHLEKVVNLKTKIQQAKADNRLMIVEKEDGFALQGNLAGLLAFEKSCNETEKSENGELKLFYVQSDKTENIKVVEQFLGGLALGNAAEEAVSNNNIQFEPAKWCYLLLDKKDDIMERLSKSKARLKLKDFSEDQLRVKLEKTTESKIENDLKKLCEKVTKGMSELGFSLEEVKDGSELVLDVMKVSGSRLVLLRRDDKTETWKLYALIRSADEKQIRKKIQEAIKGYNCKNSDVTKLLQDICDVPYQKSSINTICASAPEEDNETTRKADEISGEDSIIHEKAKKQTIEILVGDEVVVDYIAEFHDAKLRELKEKHAVEIVLDKKGDGMLILTSKESDLKSANVSLTRLAEEMNEMLRKETIDISKLDIGSLKMRKGQAREEANRLRFLLGLEKEGEMYVVGPGNEMYDCVTAVKSILGLSSSKDRGMSGSHTTQVSGGARPKGNGGMRDPLPPIPSSPNRKAFSTRNKSTWIFAWVTDITKLHVDVVVNAANEHLAHGAGVAWAISKAAGDELESECRRYIRNYNKVVVTENCLTTAGKMPSKKVMHTVGPRWEEYRDKRRFKDDLYQTFFNCLDRANKNGHESIALPAISSGIFGGPKEIVAETAVQAVVSFNRKYPSSKLKWIHLVDILQETISCFQNQLNGFVDQGALKEERGYDEFDNWVRRKGREGKTYQRIFDATSDTIGTSKFEETTDEDECSICKEKPVNPKILPKCKHTFCKTCIDECFDKLQPKCPNCGEVYGAIMGTQPKDGTMNVKRFKTSLPGYPGYCTIEIDYNIPSGTQEECHPNPGQWYKGTTRKAYLPDNEEGNEILQLLRRAFDARIVFTVGQSVTSGQDNCVVWNCIHHKTTTSGAPYGYPDATYLERVRGELAAQGIK